MSLAPGTTIGPYEIILLLGAGGMGEVYRGRDSRLGRDVAIKVLLASVSADAERLLRFEQEARAAGLLNHPNILAIYDVGAYEGIPYLISELLEGETLRSLLQEGALPQRKSCRIHNSNYARPCCGHEMEQGRLPFVTPASGGLLS